MSSRSEMNIRKLDHRPRKRLNKAFEEVEFWKEELKVALQKIYPISWKEEFWKAELRKLEKVRDAES
jgi:hypothetical protein